MRVPLERKAYTGKFLGFGKPREVEGRRSGRLQLPNGDMVIFGTHRAFTGLIDRNAIVSVAADDSTVLGPRKDGTEGQIIALKRARIVGLRTSSLPKNGDTVTISIKVSEEEAKSLIKNERAGTREMTSSSC